MELTPVIPFEPIAAVQFPETGSWIAQVKWDGVRMLSYYDGSATRLVNRRLRERTDRYPELGDAALYCDAKSVILDGEVVAFLNGKPSFRQVMRRDGASGGKRPGAPDVVFMVFDMLYLNGQWMTDMPLAQRLDKLGQVLKPGDSVQPVAGFADVSELFQVTREHGLEGIVAKDAASPYAIGGKDGRWRKYKHFRDLVALIGGATFEGAMVNSLLLGLLDRGGQLRYIGNAGPGRWDARERQEMAVLLKAQISERCPFPTPPSMAKEIVWVKPTIAVKLQYVEWTIHGTLRQPVVQSRVEADPAGCRLDAADFPEDS